MRVLVACEYSGTVRDAFIAKGHDAMSCDLLPTDKPGSYRVNGSGNVWMLRFDSEDQAKAHVKRVGLDVPMYQCVINPIVEINTVAEEV